MERISTAAADILYMCEHKQKKILIIENDLAKIQVIEDMLYEISDNIELEYEISLPRAKKLIEKRGGNYFYLIIGPYYLNQRPIGSDLTTYCSSYTPGTITLIIIPEEFDVRAQNIGFTKHHQMLSEPIRFDKFYNKLVPLLSKV